MAKPEYSAEVKAAVMAALLAGQSVSRVAEEFNIPAGTIRAWKSRQHAPGVATVATEKRARIGELIVSYLEANLTALTAQMEVFSDPEYIREQPASDAAVLHGVIADKGMRLIEALAQQAGDDEEA